MFSGEIDFRGDHLFGELGGLDPDVLDDPERLSGILERALPKGRATLRQLVNEKFDPHGVTIVAILSESHASFHTFPETGEMFVDVFTCGHCDPEAIFNDIVAQMKPERSQYNQVVRGWPTD